MNEKSEKIIQHGRQIERTPITDVPFEAQLPQGEERLIIGAKPRRENEPTQTGLEIISLVDFPKDSNGNTVYMGQKLRPEVQGLLIDPLVPPNFAEGTGYKGVKKGDVIESDVLSARFGKEIGFTVALDDENGLLFENKDPGTELHALKMTPVETEQEVPVETPEPVEGISAAEAARRVMEMEDTDRTHPRSEVMNDVAESASPENIEQAEELREEASEDLGEIAIEESVELEAPDVTPEAEPHDALEIEATPSGDTEPEKEQATETVSEAGNELVQAKAEYGRQVNLLVDAVTSEAGRSISRIAGQAEDSARALHTGMSMLNEATTTLQDIARRIDYEGGSAGAVRNALESVKDKIAYAYRSFGTITDESMTNGRMAGQVYESLQETAEVLRGKELQFGALAHEMQSKESGLEVPDFSTRTTADALRTAAEKSKDAADSLRKAGNATDGYTQEARAALSILDSIAQDAVYGRVEPQDIRQVAQRLEMVQQDPQARRIYAGMEDDIRQVRSLIENAAQQ